MSSISDRLKKMFSEFGFIVDDGSISEAEIASYECGINLIKSDFDDYLIQIFPPQDLKYKVKEYCELAGDYLEADGYIPIILGRRLAGPWGGLSKKDMDAVMLNIRYAMKYEIEDDKMIMDGFGDDDLIRLGQFIQGYIPANFTPKIKYSAGSDFEYWDGWKKKWYILDKMKMPFNIIDELRVYLYE